MKKRLYILIAFLAISILANAQQDKDALYLRNGSVVQGKIIEIKEGQYLIRTEDGLLFTFSAEEIEKFVLGERSEPKEVSIKDPDGFGFGIESGFLIGAANHSFPLLGTLNPMATYTFLKRHTVSFVSGIELFDQVTLPLLLEYRYNLLRSDVSPFLYARGGGLVSLGGDDSNEDYKGGWTWGVGTGFRWPIAGFESYIKLGYRHGITYRTEDSYYDYIDMKTYPADFTYQAYFYRFEMKWGFKF